MIIEGPFQLNYSVLLYANIPYISVTWISFATLLSHQSASEGPSEIIQLILILTSFGIPDLQTPTQSLFQAFSMIVQVMCVMQDLCYMNRFRSPKTMVLHCKNLAYIPTLCFLSFSNLFILSVPFYLCHGCLVS